MGNFSKVCAHRGSFDEKLSQKVPFSISSLCFELASLGSSKAPLKKCFDWRFWTVLKDSKKVHKD